MEWNVRWEKVRGDISEEKWETKHSFNGKKYTEASLRKWLKKEMLEINKRNKVGKKGKRGNRLKCVRKTGNKGKFKWLKRQQSLRGESGGGTIKWKKPSAERYFSKNEEEREEALEGRFVKTTTWTSFTLSKHSVFEPFHNTCSSRSANQC